MRIPPFLKLVTWQRFFVGVAIGAIVSWLVFLYIFGKLQEDQTKLLIQQKDEINELQRSVKIWQDEFKQLNKKNEQKLTVQEIEIKLINGDKYKFDSFSIFEIEDRIKDDLMIMNAKDVETVYKSRDLLKKMIENKTLKVNEKRYKLNVTEIIIYTTLFIEIEIQLET